MANLGEINVRIGADISELERGIKQAQNTLQDFANTAKTLGDSFNSLGRAFSKISLPLIGVGTAAVKVGKDFEATMQKIVGLTGTSQEQVNQWAEEIKKLAPEIGRSPQELAEALYFIASAGVDASKAIDVLKSAAKASASGLGDVMTIADALTSAVNAYAQSGLTAEQATAVLLNTVKYGKAEPAELTEVLGRVIPIAAQLKVPFEQVGAAIASITQIGLDSAEAVTALRGVFTTLMQPTKAAETQLESVGLSAEELRKMLREQGLLSVLTLLATKFQDNDEAIATIFGNVRALVGMLALTGENAENVQEVFSNMAKTTPADLDEAFNAIANTTEHSLDKALARVKTSLLELSEAVLPSVVNILEILSSVLEKLTNWWNSLDPTMQQNIVTLGAVLAAVGPLSLAIGGLFNTVSQLITGFSGLAGVIASGSPLGIALVALGAMIVAYQTDFLGFRDAVDAVVEALKELPSAIDFWSSGTLITNKIQEWRAEFDKFVKVDIPNFLEGIKKGFQEKVDIALSFVSDISRAISSWWENTDKEIKSFLAKINISQALNITLSFFSNVGERIRRWWNNILLQILEFIDKNTPDTIKKMFNLDFTARIREIKLEQLRDLSKDIGEALGESITKQLSSKVGTGWLGELRKKVKSDLPSTVREIQNYFKSLKINASQETVEMVAKLLMEYDKLQDELVGHSIIPDMVRKILEYFGILKESVIRSSQETVNQALASFGSLADFSDRLLSSVSTTFRTHFFGSTEGTAGEGAEADITAMIVDLINSLTADLADSLRNFVEGLLSLFSPILLSLSIFSSILGELDVKGKFLNSMMEKLSPVVEALLYPFSFLGEILGAILIPVLKSLWPVFKWTGVILGYVILGVMKAWNALATVINNLLGWLGANLGLIDTKPLEDGLQRLKDMTYEQAEALVQSRDALNSFTDGLLNAPQGFKVALAKYQAIEPVSLQTGGVVTGKTLAWIGEKEEEAVIPLSKARLSGDNITIENIYIATNDPEKFWRELQRVIERKKFVKTGSVVLEY